MLNHIQWKIPYLSHLEHSISILIPYLYQIQFHHKVKTNSLPNPTIWIIRLYIQCIFFHLIFRFFYFELKFEEKPPQVKHSNNGISSLSISVCKFLPLFSFHIAMSNPVSLIITKY